MIKSLQLLQVSSCILVSRWSFHGWEWIKVSCILFFRLPKWWGSTLKWTYTYLFVTQHGGRSEKQMERKTRRKCPPAAFHCKGGRSQVRLRTGQPSASWSRTCPDPEQDENEMPWSILPPSNYYVPTFTNHLSRGRWHQHEILSPASLLPQS